MWNLPQEVWTFVKTVFLAWEAYAFAGVVGVGVAIYERIRERPLPLPAFKWGATAFLLISFFVAWRTQYHATQDAELKLENLSKPKLVLEINQLLPGSNSEGAILLADVGIKNLGSPSVARGWYISLKSPTLEVDHRGPTLIPDGFKMIMDGKLRGVLRKGNRMEENITTPIQQGQLRGGWLMFTFTGISEKQLVEAIKIIHVRDILDQESSVSSVDFEKTATSGELKYYPESGESPFILPKKKK